MAPAHVQVKRRGRLRARRASLPARRGSMDHQASKNMYNGTIDTITSALSMRKKAAKRAHG
jgi:hypothetical protein